MVHRETGGALFTRTVLLCALLAASGCATNSLKRPQDYPTVVRSQPATVALGAVRDSVECDDEAYYLQQYVTRNRIFRDVVMADLDNPQGYHGADVLVSGKLQYSPGPVKQLGWGVFASVITVGGYYFLGGPTRKQATTIDYSFDVTFADQGVTRHFAFTDKREACYGLYGPAIPLSQKPAVYAAGWDQLTYLMCRELNAQRVEKP